MVVVIDHGEVPLLLFAIFLVFLLPVQPFAVMAEGIVVDPVQTIGVRVEREREGSRHEEKDQGEEEAEAEAKAAAGESAGATSSSGPIIRIHEIHGGRCGRAVSMRRRIRAKRGPLRRSMLVWVAHTSRR